MVVKPKDNDNRDAVVMPAASIFRAKKKPQIALGLTDFWEAKGARTLDPRYHKPML